MHTRFDWSDRDYPAAHALEAEQQGLEILAERLAGYQEQYPDVTVRRVVFAGNAAEHLVKESKGAQLVIVGSHGRSDFARLLLGSVGSAVIRAARIPVIVARTS